MLSRSQKLSESGSYPGSGFPYYSSSLSPETSYFRDEKKGALSLLSFSPRFTPFFLSVISSSFPPSSVRSLPPYALAPYRMGLVGWWRYPSSFSFSARRGEERGRRGMMRKTEEEEPFPGAPPSFLCCSPAGRLLPSSPPVLVREEGGPFPPPIPHPGSRRNKEGGAAACGPQCFPRPTSQRFEIQRGRNMAL